MKHLIALTLCLAVAHALKCHTCDSSKSGEKFCTEGAWLHRPVKNELSCRESFRQTFSRDLGVHFPARHDPSLETCLLVTELDPKTKNVTRVRRGCASAANACSVVRGQANHVECHQCHEDFCNSASSAAAGFALLALSLALRL